MMAISIIDYFEGGRMMFHFRGALGGFAFADTEAIFWRRI
jgi:hypothetical protein